MKILTRLIFSVTAVVTLPFLVLGALTMLNKRFYVDLNHMSASEQQAIVFSVLVTFIFFLIYFLGSIGIIFFRKWARIVIIIHPLIVVVIGWASPFLSFPQTANQLNFNTSHKIVVTFLALCLALSVYLLLPKTKKLFTY
jgi:hypothetical protein